MKILQPSYPVARHLRFRLTSLTTQSWPPPASSYPVPVREPGRQSCHNNALATSGKPHLLALPREIRDKIYEYYLPYAANASSGSRRAKRMEEMVSLMGLNFLSLSCEEQDQLAELYKDWSPGHTPSCHETGFQILGEETARVNYCNHVLGRSTSDSCIQSLMDPYYNVRTKDPMYVGERAVCRQIMQESSEMLFGKNIIELKGSLDEVYLCLTNLHPSSRHAIQQLRITIQSLTEHTLFGLRCTVGRQDKQSITRFEELLFDSTGLGFSKLRVLLLHTEVLGDYLGNAIIENFIEDSLRPDPRIERLEVASHDLPCRKCHQYKLYEVAILVTLLALLVTLLSAFLVHSFLRWTGLILSAVVVPFVWIIAYCSGRPNRFMF